MLLKLAMQVSNRAPDTTKAIIQSVLTGNNFINSNALDLEVPFGTTVGNQNPLYVYNFITRPGDQMLSSRLLVLSKSLNDTVRLAKFLQSRVLVEISQLLIMAVQLPLLHTQHVPSIMCI
jgi:hypothetical protein